MRAALRPCAEWLEGWRLGAILTPYGMCRDDELLARPEQLADMLAFFKQVRGNHY